MHVDSDAGWPETSRHHLFGPLRARTVSSRIDPDEVLNSLFAGAVVNGLRFGVLQLLFDRQSDPGEPFVNLASHWQLFAERPERFPELSGTSAEESEECALLRAIAMRYKEVMSVEVLSPVPHLVMTFTDGSVLFVNGDDLTYEPWTAGLAHVPAELRTEVIACPGGEIAFILPDRNG